MESGSEATGSRGGVNGQKTAIQLQSDFTGKRAGGPLRFQGVFSVLPTAFTRSGDLDLESLRRVVDLFVAAGVNGVTALGVTGEVARLDERERWQVLETVVGQVNGKVPVIAGATAEGTRTCVEFCKHAASLGASAVMVSPPRMAKLNSDAVVAHYKTLAASVDLPIVVQDYPPISGFAMEPALLVRIAREVQAAQTIKLEDPPTPHKTSRILALCDGLQIDILGGLGGVYLFEELMAGASGVMTGFAYPEMLLEVVEKFRSGEIVQAADSFYRYVPLMRFEFQEGVGMAIRKEVLRRRGAIADASIRAPGVALDTQTRAALESLLVWMSNQQGARWISV
jgi:4-hydroxy-tetrahydrodipicolinate synthase